MYTLRSLGTLLIAGTAEDIRTALYSMHERGSIVEFIQIDHWKDGVGTTILDFSLFEVEPCAPFMPSRNMTPKDIEAFEWMAGLSMADYRAKLKSHYSTLASKL